MVRRDSISCLFCSTAEVTKMICKFALIAALCVAQGLAFRPREKFHHGKPPCKPDLEKEIPHDFEDAMQEMDEVRETVSMAAVDAYFKGNDPDVIIACFRQQKGNFSKLGARINRMMREGNQELAEMLGDKYEKYAKRIEGPMKTIGVTMKEYPVRVWLLIKEKEFGKALEVMRQSRRIIDENSKILANVLKEMAEENPECAERAEEIARDIREEARKGCRAIGQAFRKCVEEGGPKKPIEDDAEPEVEVEAEAEVQVEEAPEQ